MKTVLAMILTLFGLAIGSAQADVVQCAQTHVDARATLMVEAEYPESARQQGAEGRVTVMVTLSSSGAITAASIYRSSGFLSLDKSALKATRASTYSPEVEACQTVSSRYLFVVSYAGFRNTRAPGSVVDGSTAALPSGSNELAGMHLSDLSPGYRERIGFPLAWTGGGVGVDAVLRGSPAYLSGLQAGDVIMDVDGTVYRNADSLNDYLSGKKHGDVIRFTVWQHGVQSPVYALTL